MIIYWKNVREIISISFKNNLSKWGHREDDDQWSWPLRDYDALWETKDCPTLGGTNLKSNIYQNYFNFDSSSVISVFYSFK